MAVCLQSHSRLEQVLSLLTGVWIAERDLKDKKVDTPAALAILMLLRCLDRVTEAAVTLFIEHFDTKQTLARLLVVQLESAVKLQALACLRDDAGLISLVMKEDPDLRISLLSQSLTKKCIAAIESISSQPPDRDVGDCIVSCLKCVALTLDATNGVTWVRLALRAGILSALLGCAGFYIYARVEDEAIAFLKRLICYLPYKPVIRQAHQSLEALSLNLDVEKPPLLSTTGKIHASWSEFVTWVEDRKQLKAQYNKLCKYACGFPECGTSGPDMRACQACLVVRYCSKACQKNHWHTHKLVCTGTREEISNENKQFLIYLASHDILLFKAQLVQQRAALLAQHPEVLVLPLCVKINYNVHPVDIEVSPMTRNVVGEPNIAREVIASRGLKTYVEIHIPSGEEVIAFPVLLEALGNWDRVDPPPTSVNDST
ncbi:hypothetical protein GGX14DRAFT_457205 [Mycena pura]|uniref:MYND-type domain-containing protein n=1 Tax=Mycena pura TaxID=153505 RepID=A0AAD6VBJ6_9AGAR|nr:hypothetical protein GGX14DRAFT_457205 [Mycena pura]